MREFALIDEIRSRVSNTRDDVVLGIGDDAAILAPRPGHELVVSTDTLVSGVHFPPNTAAFDVGWKALAVNLSDLAAMGAEPAWVTLALTLPEGSPEWPLAFVDGFAALAAEHRVALVGGDTTRGPLAITVAVHGFVPRGTALRRDGASAGDAIFVSGTLGDAAAGLAVVLADAFASRPERAALRARLDRPTPRVALGLALRGVASACIDVSDGLAADLGHVARRSGVGATVDVDALPASDALRACADPDRRRDWQLRGGDDYELCFTVPDDRVADAERAAAQAGVPIARIGTVTKRPGLVDAGGDALAPDRAGWDHFA
ncbi:thiamine-phosphate kinase [Tahibacter soli]|uniref:Thiamine-monophosphate kinase n=1 Tax=Tahibacter soli TaxID=2983605 RepID=A0A9X3YNU9_9GAMM|nr:thiamine-phosphate kinase [Tahibacter soli]MDC8014680.1 thiamine-phosphate kinase [Tahibacter soli]